MARLEDLATGTRLTGLAASGGATVESVQWIGEQGLKVIFRDDEPSLELVEMGHSWAVRCVCSLAAHSAIHRVSGNGCFGGSAAASLEVRMT